MGKILEATKKKKPNLLWKSSDRRRRRRRRAHFLLRCSPAPHVINYTYVHTGIQIYIPVYI